MSQITLHVGAPMKKMQNQMSVTCIIQSIDAEHQVAMETARFIFATVGGDGRKVKYFVIMGKR